MSFCAKTHVWQGEPLAPNKIIKRSEISLESFLHRTDKCRIGYRVGHQFLLKARSTPLSLIGFAWESDSRRIRQNWAFSWLPFLGDVQLKSQIQKDLCSLITVFLVKKIKKACVQMFGELWGSSVPHTRLVWHRSAGVVKETPGLNTRSENRDCHVLFPVGKRRCIAYTLNKDEFDWRGTWRERLLGTCQDKNMIKSSHIRG